VLSRSFLSLSLLPLHLAFSSSSYPLPLLPSRPPPSLRVLPPYLSVPGCAACISDGKWRMFAGRIRLPLFRELECVVLSISALKIAKRARNSPERLRRR